MHIFLFSPAVIPDHSSGSGRIGPGPKKIRVSGSKSKLEPARSTARVGFFRPGRAFRIFLRFFRVSGSQSKPKPVWWYWSGRVRLVGPSSL
uniref:Uncharacterized protein n=1 Tax=Arundo donax TaxID=35708 RepID=A0A0A9GQ89_ARUDO